jgi:RimJ/RimL family protein N-acetyltransferase
MPETPRLRLRRVESADLPALRSLWTDPFVMRHYPAYRTDDFASDWFACATKLYDALGYGPWTLELRDGTFVGQCGPLPQVVEGRLEVEIVCFLLRRFWRDGYAEEAGRAAIEYAFARLGVPRVIGFIMPENRPSRRLAIRCGFRFERNVERDGTTMAFFTCVNNARP